MAKGNRFLRRASIPAYRGLEFCMGPQMLHIILNSCVRLLRFLCRAPITPYGMLDSCKRFSSLRIVLDSCRCPLSLHIALDCCLMNPRVGVPCFMLRNWLCHLESRSSDYERAIAQHSCNYMASWFPLSLVEFNSTMCASRFGSCVVLRIKQN